MIRRLFILVLLVILLFCLAACNGGNETGDSNALLDSSDESTDSEPSEDSIDDVEDQSDFYGSKILVAYFSAEGNSDFAVDADATTSATINIIDDELVGNSRVIAQMAADITGGDLFFIETVKRYPSSDNEIIAAAIAESSADELPELASRVTSMSDYDVIVLVFPNWSNTMPLAVLSFLNEYDFSGKAIAPVCVFGGGGIGRSVSDVRSACPDATVLDGLGIQGAQATSAEETVLNWLRELGLIV